MLIELNTKKSFKKIKVGDYFYMIMRYILKLI